MTLAALPDGLLVVVKRECETCVEIVPALREMVAAGGVTIASQDDPAFPAGMDVIDDSDLDLSWELQTEVTPTLYQVHNGSVEQLAVGWRRVDWRRHTGIDALGAHLPEHRPGCGSRIFEPGVHEKLQARHAGAPSFASRAVQLGSGEDEHEAMFAREWSDGLPLVPPTVERVSAMLRATTLPPDEVVGVVPPNLIELSVEKAAINAVMAGCRPDYLPVVLAAVRAVCRPEFALHGLTATTYFSGPVLIVNGPIAERIGMNSGYNVFGPGNRANATIGRAVNLIVRNVGGAVPGGVDRSMQGHPSKWTMCFAEREADSPWPSLASERGVESGRSAVTAFAGQGPTPIVDQISRQPDSLARSFAASLLTVAHLKAAVAWDAMLAVSPEHARVFGEAGWDKARLRETLLELTTRPGADLVRGAGGIEEGLPEAMAASDVPKFRPTGLSIVHVGSAAGLFSGIISGWVSGSGGSEMVTEVVEV